MTGGGIRWLWAHRSVVLLVACAALALLLASSCNRARDADARAARAEERLELEREGFEVAREASRRELRGELANLAGQNAELAAELERLRRAAPGARPVQVLRATTGELVAGGAPRAGSQTSAGGSGPGPQRHDPAAAETSAAAPACLLAAGDRATVRVDHVTLETRAGNRVGVGAAEVWREWPEPRTRLLAGLFQAPASSLVVEETRPPPGWAGGVGAAAGARGAVPVVAVSPPPWRLGRWQLEVVGFAGTSPAGEFQAAAAALLRW